MKRFLRPAIGVASALAVGVAATFVGIQFASPVVVSAPAVQVEAPVLAPITTEDGVSETIGTQTVTLPGSAPTTLPDDLAALVDSISEAEDPALAITEYEEAEAPATSADDPCADAASDDCPSGLHSTVLPLVGVRELYVAATPFPPTEEEYAATGRHTMVPWCPTVDYSETEVPFGLFSTTPASYFISYWPSDDPSDVLTATARSTDEARAEYAAGQAAGTGMYDLPLQRSCVTLTGLQPDTAYTASVYAVDMFDRSAPSRQSWFNSGGPLGVPGPEISMLGDNIVFAHALHTDDERVVIQGILATESVPDPTCDAAPAPSAVLTTSESGVSDDYLLDRGVLPEYIRRANASFIIPEGSRFIVCVRVYPAADGTPSWETSFPDKETRIVVLAPDFVRPKVTVESLDIQRGSRVTMSNSTVEGIPCGDELDTALATHHTIPFALCSPARITGTVVLADELRNYGYGGELVMNAKLVTQAGDATVRQSVLGLGVQACDPVCPTPDEQRYRMRLGGADSVETALIHITWEQGRTNGAADWQVGPIETVSPDYVAPDYPDFDRNAALDDLTVNWVAKNVSLAYVLTPDRPVDYTVKITNPLPDHFEPCVDGPFATSLTQSGHADAATTLRFTGLCLGEAYKLDVTLTDAAGVTKRYSASYSGGSEFTDLPILAPGWDGELVWELAVRGPDNSVLSGLSAYVGGNRLDLGQPDTQCLEEGEVSVSGTTDVTLGQSVLVSIGGDWSDPREPGGCRPSYTTHHTNLWQIVTLDQVQWGSASQGVWLYASDGGGVNMHLWMDDFR